MNEYRLRLCGPGGRPSALHVQPRPASAALTGLVIFLNFGAGVLVQTTTTRWPAHRLIAAGLPPLLIGLVILVASAWTSPASLPLFLIGSAVTGLGGGAIIRGSLSVVISTAGATDRAGALATYFTAGYVGVSLPVLGAGVALQYLSPRVTLLIFAVVVGLGMLAAAPLLIRRPGATTETTAIRHSLKDHLADETYSVELVKRAISENRGTPLGTFFEVLSWELEDDREMLVGVMRRLGVRQTRREVIRAWIAEKIGRLRISHYSPLNALAELESLQAGIDRKIDLWSTLRSGHDGRIDFDALMHRAELQAEALEPVAST